MPTYEFDCPNDHRFEKFFRKIAGAPAVLPCPECGATATRRISGGAGLHFKGSGFYITDYGKGGKKPASTSGGGEGSGGTGDAASKGGDTKSDTKPAASEKKSDTKSTSKE